MIELLVTNEIPYVNWEKWLKEILEKNLTCTYCKITFDCKQNLIIHLNKVHPL